LKNQKINFVLAIQLACGGELLRIDSAYYILSTNKELSNDIL